jgi:photosystem II stability/assembly factor-like uncharacterized protein
MKKQPAISLLWLILSFLMAACNEVALPADLPSPASPFLPGETATDTTAPTLPSTDTPLPPAPTNTAIPPSLTPEVFIPPVPPPGPILERFPAGQEIDLLQVQMFDLQQGWAIGGLGGSRDHLFATTDGGTHWADLTPPQPGEPGTLALTAFFLDASTAWVTYSELDARLPAFPVVWHTADRGLTWQAGGLLDLADLGQSFVSDLVFIDAQHGWLLTGVGAGMSHSYVALFRTEDGGQSWTRLLDPFEDTQIQVCQKTGLSFLDENIGWLSGDCGGVMAGVFLKQTRDGGLTWNDVTLPPPADNPLLYDVNTWAACGSDDLHFFDPQTGLLGVRCTLYPAAGGDPTFASYLYATRDGGATWEAVPYPGGTLLFLDPQTGWALSRDIYQTSDGGQTWTRLATVYWDATFDFVSPQVGWAAATNDGEYALVQTSNNGRNWAMLNPVVGP